jgi:hypothetical protein
LVMPPANHLTTFLDHCPCKPTHFLPLHVTWSQEHSIATLTHQSLQPIEDIMDIETSSVHVIVLNDYSKIFSSLLTKSKGCDYR